MGVEQARERQRWTRCRQVVSGGASLLEGEERAEVSSSSVGRAAMVDIGRARGRGDRGGLGVAAMAGLDFSVRESLFLIGGSEAAPNIMEAVPILQDPPY